MLELFGVEAFYGEAQALFGVDLRVGPGEVVALLGGSGAGKTTVLRAILGLTPARRGSIRFDGRDITRAATSDIARAGIGWVPQDRRVFPALTVRRNLELGRKKSPFRSFSDAEVFELFPALPYLLERDAEQLSGGELQMVAIARALLGGPGLLLLDQPAQGLSPMLAQDVMQAIARLRAEGRAILIVEQDVRSVLHVCDRSYLLSTGRVQP